MRIASLVLILFLTLLQAGCVTPSWARVTVEPLGDDSNVHSELDYSDLIVYASFNGTEPLRMKLDTGSFSHLITPEAAERVGLQTDGERAVLDYAGTRVSYPKAHVESVVFGPVTLRDLSVTVMERSDASEIDGLLGMLGLQPFTLTLDLEQGSVRVSDERLDPEADGVMAFRFGSDYKIRVPVEMVDPEGKISTVWATLDTGYNGQLHLDRASSGRFIDHDRLFMRDTATGVHGVRYVVDSYHLRHDLVLGGIQYSGVVASANQPSNNIGIKMLEGCVITIDWPSKLIRFERKDNAQRLIDCDSLGFFDILADPGGSRAFVHPGSLAAQQGLDHRKYVLSINGQPVDERIDGKSFWPIDLDATKVVIEFQDPETGEIGVCTIPIEEHTANGTLP